MSNPPSDIVSQLMEITGINREAAENAMRINNNDLEQAINFHLENVNNPDFSVLDYDEIEVNNSINKDYDDDIIAKSKFDIDERPGRGKISDIDERPGRDRVSDIDERPGHDRVSDIDERVRAPIPSRREQLLAPGEDNFRFRKRRTPAFNVCPLRNFAREGEIQEQLASGLMDNNDSASGMSTRRNYSYFGPKRSRLEDLFRPPIDLIFWGTFQAARDYATSLNKWLIVNLQDNSEFKSQILNRDIWPDPDLKELILKYFIFWQVSADNPEGSKFKIFYHVNTLPYVCIIDPRTGECKLSCDVVTPQTFLSDLQDFLKENSYTLKSSKEACTSKTGSTQKSETVTFTESKRARNAELSEADQLELAIKNSLTETQSQSVNDDNSLDDTPVFDDSTQSENMDDVTDMDFEPSQEKYTQYLGSENDPITKIQLRLPSGERSLLEWPSSTKLRALRLHVQEKYPDITKEPFKLITPFSRQNILDLDDNFTLIQANLHPNVILHLHIDD